jgi:hypothetical protein
MRNELTQAAAKLGKPGRVCPFLLETLEDCPSRRTSCEEMCPFTPKPCSTEHSFIGVIEERISC